MVFCKIVVVVLEEVGYEVWLSDFYDCGFNLVMSVDEWCGYYMLKDNMILIVDDFVDIKWCEVLVFVYLIWWFGLLVMLKGWLEWVWVLYEIFEMLSLI